MTKSSAFTSEFCSGPEHLSRIRLVEGYRPPVRRLHSAADPAVRIARPNIVTQLGPCRMLVGHDPTEGPIRPSSGREKRNDQRRNETATYDSIV
jgi:hypothetical protein